MKSPDAERPYFEIVREGEGTLCVADGVLPSPSWTAHQQRHIMGTKTWQTKNSGRPAKSLLCILKEDTKLESQEGLASLLADQNVWRVRHRACLKSRGFESVEAEWSRSGLESKVKLHKKQGRPYSIGLTFSLAKLYTFKPNYSSYVWF